MGDKDNLCCLDRFLLPPATALFPVYLSNIILKEMATLYFYGSVLETQTCQFPSMFCRGENVHTFVRRLTFALASLFLNSAFLHFLWLFFLKCSMLMGTSEAFFFLATSTFFGSRGLIIQQISIILNKADARTHWIKKWLWFPNLTYFHQKTRLVNYQSEKKISNFFFLGGWGGSCWLTFPFIIETWFWNSNSNWIMQRNVYNWSARWYPSIVLDHHILNVNLISTWHIHDILVCLKILFSANPKKK